jgi:hypothetical protein
MSRYYESKNLLRIGNFYSFALSPKLDLQRKAEGRRQRAEGKKGKKNFIPIH